MEPSTWRQVLGITTLTTVALTIGLVIGDWINDMLYTIIDFRVRFLQLYLTTLIAGGLLTLLNRRTYRASIVAKILSMNLFWVVVMIFPATLREFFSHSNWALYPADVLMGIVVTFPLHAWMMKRGLEVWQPGVDAEMKLRHLGRPAAVGLLVFSYLAVLGSVVVVVQIYTGLPWKDVILILRGVYS